MQAPWIYDSVGLFHQMDLIDESKQVVEMLRMRMNVFYSAPKLNLAGRAIGKVMDDT